MKYKMSQDLRLSDLPLVIGTKSQRRKVFRGKNSFQGQMAHLMMFTREVSQIEVKKYMREPCACENDLVIYFPFFKKMLPGPIDKRWSCIQDWSRKNQHAYMKMGHYHYL